MIIYGKGKLTIGWTQGQSAWKGAWAYDEGVTYYHILSPSLLWKAQNIHNKRDLSVVGKWIAVNDVIILFRKEKI